jgi:hypothetical protein
MKTMTPSTFSKFGLNYLFSKKLYFSRNVDANRLKTTTTTTTTTTAAAVTPHAHLSHKGQSQLRLTFG